MLRVPISHAMLSTLRIKALSTCPTGRQAICLRAASTGSPTPARPQRYAVVGGGFAGVAAAWHLLARASQEQPVQLHLYDAYGLGAGGSGAAAGLLHPYTPRGKLLWRGLEAFQAALQLVEAAEQAAAQAAADDGAALQLQPFVWRHGILRPARTAKQARDIAKFTPADAAAVAATGARLVQAADLAALVPGLQPEQLLPSPEEAVAVEAAASSSSSSSSGSRSRGSRKPQQQQAEDILGGATAGLMVDKAVVLHPSRYLHVLWAACQQAAKSAGSGSAAELRLRPVQSLAELEAEEGPYDGVVVAAGAAVGMIKETAGLLPLDLCQGYTLRMLPPPSSSISDDHTGSSSGGSSSDDGGSSNDGSSRRSSSGDHIGSSCSSSTDGSSNTGSGDSSGLGYPAGAPSLLGSTYIAVHGSQSLVVGATKRSGLTPAEALQQCRQASISPAAAAASEEAQAAAGALLPAAAELWPPLQGWQVAEVVSGVRALPLLRGSDGSVPYAGRIPSSPTPGVAAAPAGDTPPQQQQQQQQQRWWLIGGLGARGLVYHAWLGSLVAEALLADSEASLPAELLRWKRAEAA